MSDDKPMIDERYATALNSSHLEMSLEKRGAVDLLVAAGWVRDDLGTRLFRLRKDYLDVLPTLDMAHAERTRLQAEAAEAEADARKDRSEEDAARLMAEALRLREEAAQTAMTAHVMALVHAPSLEPAKRSLGEFAGWLAARQQFRAPAVIVMAIAGRALDSWLDPLCHHCTGRGFTGGYSAPMVLCKSCGGTGIRHPRLGKTDAEHAFGRALLVEMDRKAERVARSMARFLRNE